MINKNLIQGELSKWGNGQFSLQTPLVIAEAGWMQIQKNLNQNYSRQVFIAMSFAPEMNSAYLAIQKAILELDYIPIHIDRKEHNNEISGEILNEIRNSYFVIADVTGQRNGVYFETGFAMDTISRLSGVAARKMKRIYILIPASITISSGNMNNSYMAN
jgi:hypothetical protein